PRAILHHEDANAVAIGDARIAVNHVDPGAFLPEDDGPNIGNGRSLQQRLIRDAANKVHPLPTQDLGNGGHPIHNSAPFSAELGYRTVSGSIRGSGTWRNRNICAKPALMAQRRRSWYPPCR